MALNPDVDNGPLPPWVLGSEHCSPLLTAYDSRVQALEGELERVRAESVEMKNQTEASPRTRRSPCIRRGTPRPGPLPHPLLTHALPAFPPARRRRRRRAAPRAQAVIKENESLRADLKHYIDKLLVQAEDADSNTLGGGEGLGSVAVREEVQSLHEQLQVLGQTNEVVTQQADRLEQELEHAATAIQDRDTHINALTTQLHTTRAVLEKAAAENRTLLHEKQASDAQRPTAPVRRTPSPHVCATTPAHVCPCLSLSRTPFPLRPSLPAPPRCPALAPARPKSFHPPLAHNSPSRPLPSRRPPPQGERGEPAAPGDAGGAGGPAAGGARARAEAQCQRAGDDQGAAGGLRGHSGGREGAVHGGVGGAARSVAAPHPPTLPTPYHPHPGCG